MVVTGRNPERIAQVSDYNPALKAESVDASSAGTLSAFYDSLGSVDDLGFPRVARKGSRPFQYPGRCRIVRWN